METPKYIHDCEECIYLGTYNETDLYFCDATPTVISRYSDNGPDYKSGLIFADKDIELGEAKSRAIKL